MVGEAQTCATFKKVNSAVCGRVFCNNYSAKSLLLCCRAVCRFCTVYAGALGLTLGCRVSDLCNLRDKGLNLPSPFSACQPSEEVEALVCLPDQAGSDCCSRWGRPWDARPGWPEAGDRLPDAVPPMCRGEWGGCLLWCLGVFFVIIPKGIKPGLWFFPMCIRGLRLIEGILIFFILSYYMKLTSYKVYWCTLSVWIYNDFTVWMCFSICVCFCAHSAGIRLFFDFFHFSTVP